MSHEPNRDDPEEDGSDERQEPPPSWPASPSAGTGAYPYPPEPWGPPDPAPPAGGQEAGAQEAGGRQGGTPSWSPPTPWPAPSDAGATRPLPPGGSDAGYGSPGYGSTAYGSTGYESTAYGTGGYPPRPPASGPGGPAAYSGPSGYGVPPGYGPASGSGQSGYGPASGYPGPGGYEAGYAGGPGHVQSPEQSSARTQGIVSLVLNLISVVACCNILGIVGAILAGISLGRVANDLPSAKNLIKWSWILFAAGLVLGVLAVALYVGVAVSTGAGGGF